MRFEDKHRFLFTEEDNEQTIQQIRDAYSSGFIDQYEHKTEGEESE